MQARAAVGTGVVDAGEHERLAHTAALDVGVDGEHAQAGPVGVVELRQRVVDAGHYVAPPSRPPSSSTATSTSATAARPATSCELGEVVGVVEGAVEAA